MTRYKQEVDALHASDALRQAIAALPQQTPNARKPKTARRIIPWVAAVAAVLVVTLIGVPSVFLATRHAKSAADLAQMESAETNIPDFSFSEDDLLSREALGYSRTPVYQGKSTTSTAALSTELPANRKFIRNAELSVETKTYDAFLSAVTQKLTAMGGYIQSTDNDQSYDGSRYATLVLRVPADQLDAFLLHVAEVGVVKSQSTSIEDVTDDYIDIDSRVKALETEQETLLGLLKKAEKLSDALDIQERLSEVRASLESYKGKLKALEGKIAYSTVTIHLNEVEHVTAPEGETFLAQVRANLSENLYAIGQGFRNFALHFLSSLPYIVLWAVILCAAALIVVCIVRSRRKKRGK